MPTTGHKIGRLPVGGGQKTWHRRRGIAQTEIKQKAYAALYCQQLTEVLSRYGELMEVWFDGSLVVDVGDILKKYAPRAMVLQSPTPLFGGLAMRRMRRPILPGTPCLPGKPSARWGTLTAFDGNQNGDCWQPIETDTVNVAPHTWFWNTSPERRLKTVEELMDAYYQSVGYGTVFLLNQTPDTGLISWRHWRNARCVWTEPSFFRASRRERSVSFDQDDDD